MKKVLMVLCAVMLVFGIVGTASALDFDFSGTFTQDNDVVLLDFVVGSDSTITIFSSSWVAGGFDPILAIWDSNGNLITQQDDGGRVGSTTSNGVSYSYGYWDSYFDVNLGTGTYTASITQYNNFAAGTNLSDGFVHDDNPTFTQDLVSYTPHTYFNGVGGDDDYRTGEWAFHILNVASASQQNPVPEPSTVLLLGMGLLGLAGCSRKSFRKKD